MQVVVYPQRVAGRMRPCPLRTAWTVDHHHFMAALALLPDALHIHTSDRTYMRFQREASHYSLDLTPSLTVPIDLSAPGHEY